MKRHISYQLDISTIKDIARIANRRGVSESALVDLILKEHMGEYDGAEMSLENVKSVMWRMPLLDHERETG